MKEYLKNIIISKLFLIEAIKLGDFTLKSGEKSNIYFDLRTIISYPSIYELVFEYITSKLPDLLTDIQYICGVEFGGLPLANFISFKKSIPQIFMRNGIKNHGTQKIIEGIYESSGNLLLIEDVITTGSSIKEKLTIVKDNNINLKKIFVLMDRRKVCSDNFENYSIFSLFTMDDINEYLTSFELNNSLFFKNIISDKMYKKTLTKKSNLIVACDLTCKNEIIKLIHNIGNYIIAIKLHINIIHNFDNYFIHDLIRLKNQYDFYIIEDGKFADIGNIVIQQLDGLYQINKWADLITCHTITGSGIFESIKDKYPLLGLLGIVELSTKNNLIDENYLNNSISVVKNNDENICGVICQEKVFNIMNKYHTLTFSPGINLDTNYDKHDQTYKDGKKSGMFWIIGRGIYKSDDIIKSCIKYRNNSWNHFINF